MAYDVFLVSALEDREIAKLITRRLRALKFKVRFDSKQTDDTFDAKDARDSANSQSMIVLWSGNALQSDWVRASASVGHSRPGTLIQVGLDETVPYEPFDADKLHVIKGMTSRTTPEGFFEVVDELARRDGRADLRQWMGYGSKDESQKAAWLSDHPTDPLTLAAAKTKKRKLAEKPAPAAAAAGAAALAANSIRSVRPAASGGQTLNPPIKSNAGAPMMKMADDNDFNAGWGMLIPIFVGIFAMFWLATMLKSEVIPKDRLPAIANATVMAPVCPTGEVPLSLLAPRPLETGPIIVDE